MADCGNGGYLCVEPVGEIGTLGEERVEAAVIILAEAGEVIVAELIDDNNDDELWLRRSLGEGCGGSEDGE